MHRIVLASTSPYRKALLAKILDRFEVEKPKLDEEMAKKILVEQGALPRYLAESLSQQKAQSLDDGNSVIIGGDQLVQIEGKILGKPHTEAKAIEQLLLMSGKTHEIITAVCVISPARIIPFCDITQLTMKPLSKAEAEAYVKLDQPLDCAGSYKIEKNGRALFSRIESQDFSAIEGLPLIQLSDVLQTLGYETKKLEA